MSDAKRVVESFKAAAAASLSRGEAGFDFFIGNYNDEILGALLLHVVREGMIIKRLRTSFLEVDFAFA
jgi:hypothetical protein